MTDVVECWNWLLSACPQQELVFLQEMISAWHHTRAARLGLFQSHTEEAGDPLAPTEVPYTVHSELFLVKECFMTNNIFFCFIGNETEAQPSVHSAS
jgi:hypothetical protein